MQSPESARKFRSRQVWSAGQEEAFQAIQFAPDGPDATVVTITELTFPSTEEGVRRALGSERRMDPHFIGREGVRAIRRQSPDGAQQEAYGRGECVGRMPVTGQAFSMHYERNGLVSPTEPQLLENPCLILAVAVS
jgi:hypothetical protein